ncbi:MAG: phosphoribosylanthranilate isomerase [Deltaproteobacteria bacterium]|nr:phosphoribosylanthranilate isomerase [Deltaproteobacteria bacterium]MBW2218645.1 phosphoribosylanthranilate isomerase [Deltaproteobacteria bacterium]
MKNITIPQIKICGLTNVEEAIQCAEVGANAIGLVFYSKSPRHVPNEPAKNISKALPSGIKKTGVFVDAEYTDIMRIVDFCGLDAVQLHGAESPSLVNRLIEQKLIVIKALFISRYPKLKQAAEYNASAFLVELGKGKLPGGNALPWNWSEAGKYGKNFPFILAGGLSPENISDAMKSCSPDAVDISSGVELSPGRKDINKVKTFVDTVLNYTGTKKLIKIF